MHGPVADVWLRQSRHKEVTGCAVVAFVKIDEACQSALFNMYVPSLGRSGSLSPNLGRVTPLLDEKKTANQVRLCWTNVKTVRSNLREFGGILLLLFLWALTSTWTKSHHSKTRLWQFYINHCMILYMSPGAGSPVHPRRLGLGRYSSFMRNYSPKTTG